MKSKKKENNFTEDIFAEDLDKAQIDFVFKKISEIEGIDEFIKSVLKQDRIRYFNAPVESQQYIKGAFSRFLWLLTSVRNIRKPSVDIKTAMSKMKSPRHG